MPRSPRTEGYSRRHRFTARGAFAPALRGSRKFRGRLAIVHVASGRSPHSRLGVALTRRLVPSSSDRNLVKRLIRETFRRHRLKHAGLDCVVALRAPFLAKDRGELLAEITALFEQSCPES